VVVAQRSSLRLAKQQVRRATGRQLAFAISLRWVGPSIGSSFFSLVKAFLPVASKANKHHQAVFGSRSVLSTLLLTSSAKRSAGNADGCPHAIQSGYKESD
jgi:hypothetical protein